MDLHAESERLRLDLLAVAVSRRLRSSSIDHVVLKGPSTSLWLYDEPRRYKDVDVLVPASAVGRSVDALAGIVEQRAGGVGEEAEHSLLLHSPEGFEVDVHVSLPTLPPSGDRLWQVLSSHVETMDLGVGRIPVLDPPARCLVLGLHALNSGHQMGTPLEDLRRARSQVPDEVWEEARALARALGADDLLAAGLSMVGDQPREDLTPRARLHLHQAPASAFGLERLSRTPLRRLPAVVAREIVPTSGFMRQANPTLAGGPAALAIAHVRRWGRILRELAPAWRAWRASRRGRP